MSECARSVREIYVSPGDFLKLYNDLRANEKKSYLRHYILKNPPYAFRSFPMLYEQIIQYISDRLMIPTSDIWLIGSAKTGFSIDTQHYGKLYTQDGRDLDFTIVNDELFRELVIEFNQWNMLFKNGEMVPKNEKENFYWTNNSQNVPRNISRLFIDTYKIPNRVEFVKTSNISQCSYLILQNLKDLYDIKPKEISIRVYKNWEAFCKQLSLNTERVFSTLANG
jgi:hypothetical protein